MSESRVTLCYHCGDSCTSKDIIFDEKSFCCAGCKTVYSILQQNNMCAYYDYNETPGISQKQEIREGKFDFLDNKEIISKLIQFTDGKTTNILFYIPQMHCSSCIWILEKLYSFDAGIVNNKVNFNKKELFITYKNEETTLKNIVTKLASLGYEPLIDLRKSEHEAKSNIAKTRLYKLGIAGFCFSNIMMLSFPDYLAISNEVNFSLAKWFQGISIGLSLPVLFYSGNEFFDSAYKGLKNKIINIDFPVALAVAITFIRSLYEILSGTGSGYLDSMSGIIFFLLIGRWLQEKTEFNIAFDRDFKSFFPIAIDKITDDKITPTPVEEIRPDDILLIHNHEIIPVDGILSKGDATLDYSFVSGESTLVKANIGEIIYAGAKQMSGNIEIIASKTISQSYLNNLWNQF
jgi:Cu+-exporting ATPase